MTEASDQIETLRTALAAAEARAAAAEAEVVAAARERAVLASAEATIAALRLEIEKLRRALYGTRSERKARLLDQLELQLEELEATATEDDLAAEALGATPVAAVPARERQRAVRKPFPAHLPRERVVVPAPTCCEACGSGRIAKMGEDVTETLELALQASGCTDPTVIQRPRLLSDNGPCYIAGDLADWLKDQGMDHTRGTPSHPQTQGKIERWHQTLKNRILLENYFLPGDLENQIDAFVNHYNHQRYHESLGNLTPADVYFGRGQTILKQRERIKRDTINQRRLLHRKAAA